MDRLFLMLLAIAVVAIGITYFIGKLTSRIKFLKYIPGTLCLILSMYYYYLARFVRTGEGFEDLGNFVLAIFLFAGGVFGLITAFILEYQDRNKRGR